MMQHPAVTIHGLEDGRRALAAGLPVLLLSPEGAGAWAGALWWQALIDRLRVEFPGISFTDRLDCAASPGAAMAALRVGCRALVLRREVPAWPAVAAATASLGGELFASRPESLDLAGPGAGRRLPDWLGHSHGVAPPKKTE